MTRPHGQEPHSLLYVEDEAETRALISEVLTARYPQLVLHTAANGAAGLELFRQFRPQVVLTDIRMPVMDGLEMAAEIKALDPGVDLIALTAYNDSSFLSRAEEMGFSDYVLKPIDFKDLFARIEQSLEKIKR